MTEMDAVRKQLEQCWNPPLGARDAKDMIVEIEVDMNADRTVQKARIIDIGRAGRDDVFRAAAESALRAVYNQKCNPLRLPENKYETWKRFIVRFNPKDLI